MTVDSTRQPGGFEQPGCFALRDCESGTRMLDVGVIGIGPNWEARYRPALEALRHRLRVRAVASPVIAMAEHVAADFRAEIAPSLTGLTERRDIRALLVLEPAWQGDVPV